MTTLEERYLVKERAENEIKEHNSAKKAIKFLELELEKMESLWGKYSSECLGHGITCTRLKIDWIKKHHL